MIDVVYILGKGSVWNDNELRYSLRSVEKYLSGYRNVYLIGECPEFIQNVIHIPFADSHHYRETRIALKIDKACQEKELSTEFLFMNDDHFLLTPYNAQTFPFYHKGSLLDELNIPHLNQVYHQSLSNTLFALRKYGFPEYNFDTHTPILINKYCFPSVVFRGYDWNIQNSYVVKSIYTNSRQIQGTYMRDCKIATAQSSEDLALTLLTKKIFSISDGAINGPMKEMFEILYPNKSHYEK